MHSLQVSHKEDQTEFENALREKDDQIQSLTRSIQDKDTQIGQIKTELQGKDHDIDLHKQIDAKRKEFEAESQKSF